MKNNANKWKKKPHNKTRNTHTHTGKAPTTNWSFSKACSTLTFKSIHFKLRAKIPFHFVGISFFPSWTLNDLMMFTAFHPLDKFTFLSVFSVWLFHFFSFLHFGKIEKNERFSIELYSGSFVCQKMFSCLHNSYVFKEIYNFRFKFGCIRFLGHILHYFEC